MKTAAHVLLLFVLGAAGCGPNFGWYRGENPDAPRERAPERMPAAPVTPDQITPANAHAVSEAFADELDFVTRSSLRAEEKQGKGKEKR